MDDNEATTKEEDTMPFKDKAAELAWRRKYRKKHPEDAEEAAERKFKWYQDNLDRRRKLNEKANRAAGHVPRPKGPNAKPEIKVAASKRYRFINGTIYFTSKRGFTVSEVRDILRMVTQEAPAPRRKKRVVVH